MKSKQFIHNLEQMIRFSTDFPTEEGNRFPRVVIPAGYDGDPADVKAFSKNALGNFEALRNLFERAEHTVKNMGYKNKYIAHENLGYCLSDDNGSDEVNANHKKVDEFVNDILTRCSRREHKFRGFVTGKVGVGKSTFLNYVIHSRKVDFMAQKISFIRFGYADYGFDMEFSAEETVRKKIAKDIINKSAIRLLADHCTQSTFILLSNYFLDLVNAQRISREDYDSLIVMLDILMETRERKIEINIEDYEHACAGLSLGAATRVVKYFYEHGCNVVVVFDGLDRLSPDDWYTERFKRYMVAVQHILFDARDLGECRGVLFHYILVLRNCTFKHFLSNRLEHHQGTEQYKVKAKPARLVVETAVNCILFKSYDMYSLHVKDNLLKMFMSRLDRATEVFSLESADDLVRLFEFNHRKTFRFLYDVALFSACTKHDNVNYGKKNEQQKFAKFLSSFKNSKFDIAHYRYFELFLFADNNSFNNYYFVNKREDRSKFFSAQQRDRDRGHVDNVFNYTFYSNNFDVPSLLEKVRILQYCNEYTESEDIIEFLHDIGYSLNRREFNFTIRLMIDSCLLKVRANGSNSFSYKRTYIGDFIIDSLLSDYTYMAHACMVTLLPPCISKMMWKRYHKYDTYHFVRQNVINCYLFLRYLKYIEELEMARCENKYSVKSKMKHFQLHDNLVQDYLERVPKIIGPLMQGKRIDIDELYADILEVNMILEQDFKVSSS